MFGRLLKIYKIDTHLATISPMLSDDVTDVGTRLSRKCLFKQALNQILLFGNTETGKIFHSFVVRKEEATRLEQIGGISTT